MRAIIARQMPAGPRRPWRARWASDCRVPVSITAWRSTSAGSATATASLAHPTSAPRSGSTAPRAACRSPCWPCLWSAFGFRAELRFARQLEQQVAIDMLFDVIGKFVERRLDLGFIGKHRRRGTDSLQPVMTLAIVGKQPVDVAAGDPAVGAHRSVVLPGAEPEHWPRRAGGASDMHLVALEGHIVRQDLARRLDQDLVALQHGLDVEQAEPVDRGRLAFDAVRVGDRPAQHLITAANAEHESATPLMRPQVDVPSGRAQGGEVGDGGFRAWQNDER